MVWFMFMATFVLAQAPDKAEKPAPNGKPLMEVWKTLDAYLKMYNYEDFAKADELRAKLAPKVEKHFDLLKQEKRFDSF